MKLLIGAEEFEAKVLYYGKARRITVCLILDAEGGILARGLSFCSYLDHPNKKRGRAIAVGRAVHAIKKWSVVGKEIGSFGRSIIKRSQVLALMANHQIDFVNSRDAEAWAYKELWRPSSIPVWEYDMIFKKSIPVEV